MHKEPQPLAEIRPDLPAALCAIIHKMMAKKPEDRYQTAREILRDINQLREALNLGAVAAISISSSFIGTAPEISRVSPSQPLSAPASSWVWPTAIGASVLLALMAGLVFGWVQHHNQLPNHEPPPVKEQPRDLPPAQVILPPPKKPTTSKEAEKQMQSLAQKYLNPTEQAEVMTGVVHLRELGFFYLDARRHDDAEKLFTDLSRPDGKVAAYRLLGRIGRAITLAFKDEPAASNKEFLAIAADIEKIEARVGPGSVFKPSKKDSPDDFEAYKHVWKLNTSVRKMVAKALNHNYANDPASFAEKQPAEKLNAYRIPPRPTVKAAPVAGP